MSDDLDEGLHVSWIMVVPSRGPSPPPECLSLGVRVSIWPDDVGATSEIYYSQVYPNTRQTNSS